MKKIIASVCAIAMAATVFVAPAQADNSEEVIIGVLGGALGGLVLGEVLARPRYAPAPVYVQPAPEYVVRECWYKTVRRYNPNTGTYVRVKKKVCDYVPY
jgi:hypothetical protein